MLQEHNPFAFCRDKKRIDTNWHGLHLWCSGSLLSTFHMANDQGTAKNVIHFRHGCQKLSLTFLDLLRGSGLKSSGFLITSIHVKNSPPFLRVVNHYSMFLFENHSEFAEVELILLDQVR